MSEIQSPVTSSELTGTDTTLTIVNGWCILPNESLLGEVTNPCRTIKNTLQCMSYKGHDSRGVFGRSVADAENSPPALCQFSSDVYGCQPNYYN